MKAARVHKFGPPEAIVIDDIPKPAPGPGEVVVRVTAAGVGPWDALIREGKSAVDTPLPLILGSDLAGTIDSVGAGVASIKPGDEVYGVTNASFCGAYADFAVASAKMLAPKPNRLTALEAASVPVVAVTAWQMLFDYGNAKPGQTVLIHGGAGNVGAYAIQIAKYANLRVITTASDADATYVQKLGADQVLDYKKTKFDEVVSNVDLVLDTVGGEIRERSMRIIKPGGILVTAVSPPPASLQTPSVRAVFFLVEVTTDRLNTLSKLFDEGKLRTDVATVLPLGKVRLAHEMLAGAPHKRGKILLQICEEK